MFGASDRTLGAATAERRRAHGNRLGELMQVNQPLFKGDGGLVPPRMCTQMPLMKASRFQGKTRSQLVTESIMRGAGPKDAYGPPQRGFQEVPMVVSPQDRIAIPRPCMKFQRQQDTVRQYAKERAPPAFKHFGDATETPKTVRLTAPTPNCRWFGDQRLQARHAAARYADAHMTTGGRA